MAFVIRENNCNPLRKVCVQPMEPSEVNRATVSWLKERKGEDYGRMLPSSESRVSRPHSSAVKWRLVTRLLGLPLPRISNPISLTGENSIADYGR
jgi:hypothetical protein